MQNILIIMFLFLSVSCQKEEAAKPSISWIQELITKGSDSTGVFTSVYSYTFAGKTVYLFNYANKCCDNYTAQLFDESGKSLCYPYGGISGKGDLKCQSFDAEKTNEKLYWK